jgi:hypothetical protein
MDTSQVQSTYIEALGKAAHYPPLLYTLVIEILIIIIIINFILTR